MFVIGNRFLTRFPLLNPCPPSSRHERPFRPWFSCFTGAATEKRATESSELVRHEVAIRVITVVTSGFGRSTLGLRQLSRRNWKAVPLQTLISSAFIGRTVTRLVCRYVSTSTYSVLPSFHWRSVKLTAYPFAVCVTSTFPLQASQPTIMPLLTPSLASASTSLWAPGVICLTM